MIQLCYETINFSPWIAAQEADLPAQIRAAAAAGFPLIGIDSASVAQQRERGGSLAELAALVRDSGMRCFAVQALVVGADPERTCEQARTIAEVAAALEPDWVQCGVGAEPDAAVADAFASAAEVIAPSKARLSLEYLPFTPLRDIAGARELLRRADVPGAAIVVDTWHHFHGPDGWPELEALPVEEIAYVQFSDHHELHSDDLFHETTCHRALPGHGILDLARFCRTLRAKAYDQPVSVEILSEEMRTWPHEKFARRAYDSAARFWE